MEKIYQLPISINYGRKANSQISDRIKNILSEFKGKTGAKQDFLDCNPEFDTLTGRNLLIKAFTQKVPITDVALWIALENWVLDVKERKPNWFTKIS